AADGPQKNDEHFTIVSRIASRAFYFTVTVTLLAVREFPVARCSSAIALFKSVCARNSLPRATAKAVCRSSTRNTLDWPASSLRFSLSYCCSAVERATAAERRRA